MKRIYVYSVAAAIALGAVSCSTSGTNFSYEDKREAALKKAAIAFVDNTVIPTYHAMADAAVDLAELCVQIEASANANAATDIVASGEGTLSAETSELLAQACEKWYEARKYWELSEAFLYGAAGDYFIDPHIDSWPLDAAELQALLDDDNRMDKMDAEYAGSFLGYGLLGFHAVEYMIFDIYASTDNTKGEVRNVPYGRAEELVFLTAVAGDLANQCVRLEAAGGGMEKVSAEKQQMLTDAELEP